MMLQIKISITEEECALLQERANKNLNSLSREARLILRHVLYNEIPTPASVDPVAKQREIAGIEFPAFPDYSIYSSTSQLPPQSYQHANTTAITSTPTSHTHADITPPGVQSAASQTIPSQPTTTQITPDPHAGTIDIKPGVLPSPIKDYTQSQSQPKSEQNTKPIVPVSTDLEIEQVDNEWDAEGNEYSTEDFLFDLRNLEEKMREDLPAQDDPTRDPDYVVLKNYFIKHDLRERFRSLLSDPSRFYSEEGVYDNPQIRYARHAFRREKIDEDYIVALLSGTGANYRRTHKVCLYTNEQ